MSAAAAAAVKAAILALTDENTRKKIGWVLAAILSPVILLIAFLCALGSGTASHNLSVVELCFYGGTVPSETPDEYRAYIEEMRAGFNLLDGSIENINELTEGEDGLDEIRVKALFYALYFGADSPGQQDCRKFADCFVAYEERTRTVTVPGRAARMGVPVGTARSIPVCPRRCPVIGSIRLPNSEVTTLRQFSPMGEQKPSAPMNGTSAPSKLPLPPV